MAGIGFELRKIWKGEYIISRVRGFAYATLVSSGPMIISVSLIVVIGQYMKQSHVPVAERDLVNTVLMYSYIFAMVLVSFLAMNLSRYLADQIYLNNTQHILASLVGSLAVLIAIGSLLSFGFLVFAKIPLLIKFLSYMLFIELSCSYLLMVYLSAVKDYKIISLSFFIGMMMSIFLVLILRSVGVPVMVSMLAGVVAGFMVSLSVMLSVVKKHFYTMSSRVFHFIQYILKMPLLFFTSTLYTAGLFAHNFIFWLFSDLSIHLNGAFVYSPSYDNATFFAVLSIIPSTVLFVVRAETSFYEKYRIFCSAIARGGNLKAIDMTKEQMVSTLRRELSSLFETQFIITLILIILGSVFLLPALDIDGLTIGIFAILSVGYFLVQMMFIVMTILLYFDDQEDSLYTTVIFFGLTVVLTVITLFLGKPFYGLGLCLGALAALLFAASRLTRLFKNVDYRLFSKPPYMSESEVNELAGTDSEQIRAEGDNRL